MCLSEEESSRRSCSLSTSDYAGVCTELIFVLKFLTSRSSLNNKFAHVYSTVIVRGSDLSAEECKSFMC